MKRLCLCLAVLAVVEGATSAGGGPPQPASAQGYRAKPTLPALYLPAKPSSGAQVLAVSEVRRVFYLMTGQVADAVQDLASQPTLFIGPSADPLVRKLAAAEKSIASALAAIKPGGYAIRSHKSHLLVIGSGDDGLRAGCARLLEAYGCGFYLGGDTVPRRPVLPWPLRRADGAPKFEVRGLLPWYNFWDSPTTWNLPDWRDYLDAMVRERLNLIALHAYDFEPFCAYRYGDRWLGGLPLFSTAQDNWGCRPMRTDEFGFGSGRIYYQEHFGADLATAGLGDEGALQRQQEMLADALAYARAAGVRTCLGFEVGADPTDPEELQRLEARIRHVLSRYPLDYLWIWQPESMGLTGISPPEPSSRLGTYVRRWHDVFAYLGDEKRIAEAVRMTLYVQAARQILAALSPRTRLAVAGWGGDQWMRFSDFFPGMDKLVPKDVIFGALDNISVTPNISVNYGMVKGRDLWPTPWFEYDGDQWVQQPNTAAWAGAVADAEAKGCTGILGIHWRTRAVEESVAYMARYAWGEAGPVENFYQSLAAHWFGEKAVAEGARILLELQGLGYRWTGGAGQAECGPLGWAPGRDEAKLAKLRECREALARLLAQVEADTQAPQMAAERVRWLLAMADWTEAYELTARAMSGDGEATRAVNEARAGAQAGVPDTAQKAAAALDVLAELPFGAGLARLVPTVSNRGEPGVVASINCKAWWEIRERMREMAALAGRDLPQEPDLVASLGPAVVAFERPTTWPAGEEFKLRAGLLGATAGKLCWRPWGGTWREMAMRRLRADVWEAVLRPAAVKSPGIEWYIQATTADGRTVRFPDKGTWATAVVPSLPRAGWRDIKPPAGKPSPPRSMSARQLDYGGVELTWEPSADPGVAYEVLRRAQDGTEVPLALTFDTWIEDCAPPAGRQEYVVTPLWLGGQKGQPAVAALTVEARKPPAPAQWKALPGPRRIVIELPGGVLGVRSWRVYLRTAGEADWRRGADIPAGYVGTPARAAVLAPGGRTVEVTVAAVGIAGVESDRAAPVSVTPLDQPPRPVAVFAGEKTDLPEGAQLRGNARFVDDPDRGRVLELGGGWVEMGLPEGLRSPAGLTLSLWLKPASWAGRMPVIVSHGTWRQDGFFLQILGANFRWHKAPATDCDGGAATAGQWQHVIAVWDGAESRTYLNGALVARTPTDPRFLVGDAPLYVGRYIFDQEVYYFRGRVADVRIYPWALTEDEFHTILPVP
ncbi:MAG: LamG domain-containing protein [Armatimonadetes bacterium]|nr:LamG domain-containing protein [Armatimonadota bacterium]